MNIKNSAILFLILLFASALRFYGINWDQGYALHPDERFMLMVANDAKFPTSLIEYLNPNLSPLNPYNSKYTFFVYGTFPTTLNRSIAHFFNSDNYEILRILGRSLSAIFDIFTLLTLYLIVYLLERIYKFPAGIKFLAAFLYAISVLPIQQSHFFTADCFQTFGVVFSVLSALYCYYYGNKLSIIFCGIAFGIGIGSKISAIYILPLVLPLLVFNHFVPFVYQDLRTLIIRGLPKLIVFVVSSYLTIRFVDPKFFASANFLDPEINPQFIKNLKEVNMLSTRTEWPFPPSVQWLSSTPIWSPLKNLALYGIGFPYALLVLYGAFTVFVRRWYLLAFSVIWAIAIFIFQGSRFVHSMRYFFVLFPLFALLAALGFWQLRLLAKNHLQVGLITSLLLIAVLIWPLAFFKIYTRTHSRITASEWIYNNIPSGSVIATEHWDDGLPLSIPNQNNRYENVQLPVFYYDNEEKWQEINQALEKADYIIFSSNRGYGSLMPQRQKIPRTVKWYEDLFAGRSNFLPIKEFTSFPGLQIGSWKYEFDTQNAEEAFSVYDHPKVNIFKKKQN